MNAQHDHNTTRPTNGRGYLNAVLTANAVLLGVIALGGLGVNVGFSSVSNAQTGVSEGTENMISAAEQRKSMVTELRGISARLDKIDATLAKGVNVTVKNFPANFGKDGDKTDAPSESTRQPEIKKVDRPAPKTGNLQQK